jgi:DNA-binding LacI/PurR family transcriptional regulator
VQDFYEGTYRSLESAYNRICRYNKLHLSFPEKSGHPGTLEMGFVKFCTDHYISYKIEDSLKNVEICKGDAYLVIDDSDLIKLLKTCKVRNWSPGRDIGVISYNETPLKGVIRDGISVISCNFKMMAQEMAEFIKNRAAVRKIIPINYIKRNSL